MHHQTRSAGLDISSGFPTVYTGDVINEKKLVHSLNTDDPGPEKKYLLYFQGVQMATGQHWYGSVIVAKGSRPGKRITADQWGAWRCVVFSAYGSDGEESLQAC